MGGTPESVPGKVAQSCQRKGIARAAQQNERTGDPTKAIEVRAFCGRTME
jgi:hypothetical protein